MAKQTSSAVISLTTIVLLCFVGSSMQLGTLWVNQIWGNSDTHYVNIEQVRIDDNTMYVDFVNQLGTNGVSVEQTVFQAGNVHVPVNLTVDQTGTVSGVLNANGGIYADDAVNGGYSFTVQDNTGVTTISGLLNANGGINVNQGRFTVSGTTGETIIDTAPLRPNGGIDSNYGQFTVNPNDGSVLTKGQLNVNQDIVLGTNVEEDRFVRRVPTTAAAGGNTFIRGQDGIFVGGNLDLIPGYAAIGNAHGQIIFGRPQNDNLVLSRATSLATGGQTVIAGQSSTTGAGGDLLVKAGSTTVSTSAGGNLYLVPGTSTQPGSNGDIILGGANDPATPEFDLTIRRPDAVTLNGGMTTLQGQNGLAGNGGDLVLAAGNGAPTGAASPVGPFGGDLVLQPGVAVNQLGKIILGRSDNDELYVTRVASVADAGATYFKGQDSALGQGGDVRIIAGDAATDPAANTATAPNQNGGDIHLVTGLAANAGTPGAIYWGVAQQPLEVRRELGATGTPLGTDTSIFGQQSAIGRGGDLNLFSGVGPTGSGNLVIQTAPTAAGQRAGTISIFASDTDTPNGRGGDIRIFAGNGVEGNGGVVSLSAGSGTVGGNIILQAGAGGTTAGQVIVKSGATLFLVDSAPVIIDNGDLILTRSGTEQVRLSANPNSILTVNGNVVLKSRITQTIAGDASSTVNLVAGLDTNSVDNFLTDLQNSLNAVIRALSPCGHGLFNVYDPVNNIVVSDGTAGFCKASLNKRRNLGATAIGGVDILDKNSRAQIKCGTNSAAILTPLTPTARGAANSPATTANGVPETAPPLSFLVNDPNSRKCLMYNDAISGPDYNGANTKQATTQGVLAAGYIHDNAQDPEYY